MSADAAGVSVSTELECGSALEECLRLTQA